MDEATAVTGSGDCFTIELQPVSSNIDVDDFEFAGWITCRSESLRDLGFCTISGPLDWAPVEGPADQGTTLDVVGFRSVIRVRDHLAAIRGSTLTVFVLCNSV